MTSSLINRPSIPFPRTYWVVPGSLLAGPYPGDLDPDRAEQRLTALLDCGIRHVINLMEETEVNHQGRLFVPYAGRLYAFAASRGETIGWTRFAIPDGTVPPCAEMQRILDQIDHSIDAGRPVYVHCWGGKGRTGLVVGCYLIRHNLATAETVLDRINRLRQHIHPYKESPETDEQREFVLSWKAGE